MVTKFSATYASILQEVSSVIFFVIDLCGGKGAVACSANPQVSYHEFGFSRKKGEGLGLGDINSKQYN